jgi:DNA-binding response OmpR family regulator
MSLVIEDDPDVRALLCLILVNAGFEAQAAATGLAAKELNPVLITIDVGLPTWTGTRWPIGSGRK